MEGYKQKQAIRRDLNFCSGVVASSAIPRVEFKSPSGESNVDETDYDVTPPSRASSVERRERKMSVSGRGRGRSRSRSPSSNQALNNTDDDDDEQTPQQSKTHLTGLCLHSEVNKH